VARVLKVAVAVITGALYVWFAAVRNLPLVKRRKARRRLAARS
jgi:hypothetical protein